MPRSAAVWIVDISCVRNYGEILLTYHCYQMENDQRHNQQNQLFAGRESGFVRLVSRVRRQGTHILGLRHVALYSLEAFEFASLGAYWQRLRFGYLSNGILVSYNSPLNGPSTL